MAFPANEKGQPIGDGCMDHVRAVRHLDPSTEFTDAIEKYHNDTEYKNKVDSTVAKMADMPKKPFQPASSVSRQTSMRTIS